MQSIKLKLYSILRYFYFLSGYPRLKEWIFNQRRILAIKLIGNKYSFAEIFPSADYFPVGIIHTNVQHTKAGWQLLNRGYDDEARAKNAIVSLRKFTMVTHDGLLVSYDIARYVQAAGIAGSIVETGVCQGGSAAIMCIALKDSNVELPQIHLFDSFEGLPHPNEIDYMPWMEEDWALKRTDFDGILATTGALVATQECAEEAVFKVANYPRERTHFYKGWFQDTIPGAKKEIGKISILRLDGDLYESTLFCLRELYPQVTVGGFIIIDDYGLIGCRKACEQYFSEIGIKPFLSYIDAVGRYFIKTH